MDSKDTGIRPKFDADDCITESGANGARLVCTDRLAAASIRPVLVGGGLIINGQWTCRLV